MKKIYELDFYGKKLSFEIGRVAKQANAAVLRKVGATLRDSVLGQLLWAAGALGALKGALALSHRILPPSVTPVDEGFLLRRSQGDYYWVQEARPWIAARTRPRRLAVSTLSRWGRAGAATLEEIGD